MADFFLTICIQNITSHKDTSAYQLYGYLQLKGSSAISHNITDRAFYTLNEFSARNGNQIKIAVSQRTNDSIARHQKNIVTNSSERINPSKFRNDLIFSLTH